VYVFDFFSKLTDANGYMRLMYAMHPDDPHPNAAATELVAPQLVNEVFNHSIFYESVYGIKKLSNIVPEKYCLHQNYPNPFNPVSKIKMDIVKFSNVKLVVYDALGRKITILVNEQLRPGTYEVEFDAIEYPSGVYFYSLTTGDFINTKEMLLIK